MRYLASALIFTLTMADALHERINTMRRRFALWLLRLLVSFLIRIRYNWTGEQVQLVVKLRWELNHPPGCP